VLDDGRTLSGTVSGVCGGLLRTVTYSRVSAKHRLAMWMRWLALTAAHPERPFEAAVVGRARLGAKKGCDVTVVRLPALAPDAAERRELALGLHDRGTREPLPLACLSSAAYAHGRKPEAAGRKAWESEYDFDKEDKDLEHQLVFGGVCTFAELLEHSPRSDEAGEGWDATETTRFGRYARRLWTPVLAHEEVSDH
jgi:exodeoxyribonuclease V gamma subunit